MENTKLELIAIGLKYGIDATNLTDQQVNNINVLTNELQGVYTTVNSDSTIVNNFLK